MCMPTHTLLTPILVNFWCVQEQIVGKMLPLCAVCLSVCPHAVAVAVAAALPPLPPLLLTTTTGSLHIDLTCILRKMFRKTAVEKKQHTFYAQCKSYKQMHQNCYIIHIFPGLFNLQ